MHLRTLACTVIAAALPVCAQETFPPVSPESVGISPSALADLSAAVKALIDEDQAPGAELLVIKNRRTVLHEAFGFKDRDDNKPMERNTLFCIRSMTKSVVGTAMQMLIDEGKVSLDDRASKFLPSFDSQSHREITVGQLLTHTSGLPLSQFLLGKQLTDFHGVREVADDSGGLELEFPPGAGFNYSDAGADTITALVEVISGMPIEQFLAERLFKPLGMSDAVCVMTDTEPRRARTSSNYVGSAGAWSRYWDPSQPPIFSYFLGSQAMYDTPSDYARLLALWMDDGRVGDRRLLSPDAVARGLKPANQWKGFPTGFGSEVWYGQFWLLYLDPALPEAHRITAFGHSGSDGTFAWAWPERDLMVLYFTQARGGMSGFEVESAINRTLINPGAARPVAAAPADLDRFTGYYWDDDEGMYRLISRHGDGLQIEIPGKAVDPLRAGKTPQTWTLTIQPQVVLSFDLDAPGPASGMWAGLEPHKGQHWLRMPDQHDLPTPEDLAALRARAHGTAWADLGAFRRSGTMEMPAQGIKGTIVSTVDGPVRSRTELNFGPITQTILTNAGGAWIVTSGQPAMELKGAVARQAALDNPAAIFGDWRGFYDRVEVVARTGQGLDSILIVRAVPSEGNPTVFTMNAETGLLRAARKVAAIPGMGPMGAVTRYSDYRAVGGLNLPFRFETEYDSPLLGSAIIQFDTVEPDVQVDKGAFDAPESKSR